MPEKDRKKGTVTKENGNLLERKGEDDCIWVLSGLFWLQCAKSFIALDSSDNSGTKILS